MNDLIYEPGIRYNSSVPGVNNVIETRIPSEFVDILYKIHDESSKIRREVFGRCEIVSVERNTNNNYERGVEGRNQGQRVLIGIKRTEGVVEGARSSVQPPTDRRGYITFHTHPSDIHGRPGLLTLPSDADLEAYNFYYPTYQMNLIVDYLGIWSVDFSRKLNDPEIVAAKEYIATEVYRGQQVIASTEGSESLIYVQITDMNQLATFVNNFARIMKQRFGITIGFHPRQPNNNPPIPVRIEDYDGYHVPFVESGVSYVGPLIRPLLALEGRPIVARKLLATNIFNDDRVLQEALQYIKSVHPRLQYKGQNLTNVALYNVVQQMYPNIAKNATPKNAIQNWVTNNRLAQPLDRQFQNFKTSPQGAVHGSLINMNTFKGLLKDVTNNSNNFGRFGKNPNGTLKNSNQYYK